jgi:hypothetical protein
MQFALAQSVDELYEAGEQRIQQAQAQQAEVEQIADITEDRLQDYLQLVREIEDLEIYNNVLSAQVEDQRRQLRVLNDSIDGVDAIQRQILPLMNRMINALERFIDLDIPFLLDARYERVERLRALMFRSDVTPAEQFRNVLQAWMIEMNDYGLQGDVYTDSIMTPDGAMREVRLLRIGRIALIYLTPDGSQAGAWNKLTGQWERLEDSMIEEVRIGIEAYETKQGALFVAPVPPPEDR